MEPIVALRIPTLVLVPIAVAAGSRRTPSPPAPVVDERGTGMKCLRCGGSMSTLGVERFRTGGTSGGWKLPFGKWAELGEDMLDLEILACTCYRRVEMPRPGGAGV